MDEATSTGWVSVRCLFRWLRAGEQIYEERITVWHTSDGDEAVTRAETEALAYAEDSTDDEMTIEYLGLAQGYLLADELVEGAEVFSLLRTHPADPTTYLDTFFDTGAEHQHDLRQH